MKFPIKLLFLLFISLQVQAQEFPQPVEGKIVHDFASLLKPAELNQLETMLVRYSDTTSTQIAVVTLKTMHGYEVNDYGTRLYNRWGIGQSGKNNGILILIAPASSDDRRNRIAIITGYGMEALVPDVLARRIIDHEMAPRFREGAYFEGISAAAGIIFQLAAGSFNAEKYMQETGGKGKENNTIPIIILVVIVLLFSGLGGKKRGGKNISSRGNIPLWILLSLLNSAGGRGSFGGFSSGGGGFGGFGGGRSGGGGASGTW